MAQKAARILKNSDSVAIKQRGELVKKADFVDYGLMSAGELTTRLVHDRLKMLSEFYPDVPEYRKGTHIVHNILHNGLHQAGRGLGIITSVPAALNPFLYKIKRAQSKNTAAGFLKEKSSSKVSAIGMIPVEDCKKLLKRSWNPFKNRNGYTIKSWDQYTRCKGQRQKIEWLNAGLEGTGHHLIYNYLKSPNSEPNLVSTKTVTQRSSVELFSNFTGVSMDNILYWMENGVMRKNAGAGAGAIDGRLTTEHLRFHDKEGIGEITIATATLIVGIVNGILGAIGLWLNNKRLSDQEKNQLELAKLGLASTGYEEGDFNGGGGGSGISTGLIIGGIVAAGVGAAVLSSNKSN